MVEYLEGSIGVPRGIIIGMGGPGGWGDPSIVPGSYYKWGTDNLTRTTFSDLTSYAIYQQPALYEDGIDLYAGGCVAPTSNTGRDVRCAGLGGTWVDPLKNNGFDADIGYCSSYLLHYSFPDFGMGLSVGGFSFGSFFDNRTQYRLGIPHPINGTYYLKSGAVGGTSGWVGATHIKVSNTTNQKFEHKFYWNGILRHTEINDVYQAVATAQWNLSNDSKEYGTSGVGSKAYWDEATWMPGTCLTGVQMAAIANQF